MWQRYAGIQGEMQLTVGFVAGRSQGADASNRCARETVFGNQPTRFRLIHDDRTAEKNQRADTAERQTADAHACLRAPR